MSDQLFRSESNELMRKLNEDVDKLEQQIVELNTKAGDLEDQKAKLMEKIEKLNREKTKSTENLENSHHKKISLEDFNKWTSEVEEQMHPARKIPNWLIEVLEWIKRTEMAASALSTSCWTFKELCWPKLHGNMKKHTIECLSIFHQQDNEMFNLRAEMRRSELKNFYSYPEKYEIIPIAVIKPPEYIVRLKHIHLCFLDDQILEFVQNILQLLDNNSIDLIFPCNQHIPISGWTEDNVRIRPICHLLKMLAQKTFELRIDFPEFLLRDCSLFPGLLDQIQSIFMNSLSAEECNLLIQWLMVERADGEPKIVSFPYGIIPENLIERIIEEFEHSTLLATFIIEFIEPVYPDLNLENEQTREVLAIYQSQDLENYPGQFLVRHRKGSEHLKANWEKLRRRKKHTYFSIDIGEIGTFQAVPPVDA